MLKIFLSISIALCALSRPLSADITTSQIDLSTSTVLTDGVASFDFDFESYFNGFDRYIDCFSDSSVGVRLTEIAYHDFDQDGVKEAIVTGYSCFTGTAGPDIHEIVKVVSSTEVIHLKINDNEGIYKGKPLYDDLQGNRNYQFEVYKGKLVQKFRDESNRKNPLTIFYIWNGNEFSIIDVEWGVKNNGANNSLKRIGPQVGPPT